MVYLPTFQNSYPIVKAPSTHVLIWVAVALFAFSACTGPTGGRSPAQPEEPRDPLPNPVANLAAYEDFDPSPYRIPAPGEEREIEHDVPARLMQGSAAAGVSREVQGFRIQIFASGDKADADEVIAQAVQWWDTVRGEAPEGLLPDDLPIYVEYRQPYYRVRIGNFVSRAQAEEALAYITQRFGGAFITPSTVTVTQ